MVDYRFYQDCYYGDRIPEKAFNRCMARAREALACFDRRYQVTGGEEERKLALCAMAEAVYDDEGRDNLLSASMGNVSVRYQDAVCGQLWRELRDKASIYLQLYRGVK